MSTLKVVAKQTMLNQQIRNVFFVAGAYATHTNGQSIVDYIADAWETGSPTLQTRLSNQWSLDGFEVKDVSDPDNPVIPYNITGGVMVGGSAVEPLPMQNCMLVQFKATTAPPNRSRKYLGGFTEGAHSGSGWDSVTLTAVGLWADFLLDMPTGLDTGITITATRIDKTTGVLVGSNILDQFSISTYARTQRRRTPGRGI